MKIDENYLISIGEKCMREKYESLALTQLKELAKIREIKGASTMKKAELVEAMLLADEKDKEKQQENSVEKKTEEKKVEEKNVEEKKVEEK